MIMPTGHPPKPLHKLHGTDRASVRKRRAREPVAKDALGQNPPPELTPAVASDGAQSAKGILFKIDTEAAVGVDELQRVLEAQRG
jgi:hypothetical protein